MSEAVSSRDTTGALFVGAGPAGLAPLVWAAREGLSPALAARGLTIVEPSSDFGSGRIGAYAIASDTAAGTFLECLNDGGEPRLSALRSHPLAQRLAASGSNAVALPDVAEFLALLGREMAAILRGHGATVIVGRADAGRRNADGHWVIDISGSERTGRIVARSLVLATGAAQGPDCLDGVSIGDFRLDQDLDGRVLLSDQVLGSEGLEAMRQHLRRVAHPKVAIVGGSHSALAAAWRVLHELPEVAFGDGAIAILHRRKLRPFYVDTDVALADGFRDFDNDDVCPVSGRLFRLGGFRFRARELVRQSLGLGNALPEPRLVTVQLGGTGNARAETTLREATLVIAALGYRPRALPLYDREGGPIHLGARHTSRIPLVNDACEVLDLHGQRIEGVFAIGLAAGFRPSGELGGEPSFSAQTNGLWLWQNGVGERIVRRLLAN